MIKSVIWITVVVRIIMIIMLKQFININLLLFLRISLNSSAPGYKGIVHDKKRKKTVYGRSV